MKVNFFLSVGRNGSLRVAKKRPDLKSDEVSVKMNLHLPDMLFQKPQLEANIVVPESSANPQVIKAEVADNIKEAIQQVSGMEVRLNIVGQ